MLEREEIIAELWKRLSNVSGVKHTARNPKAPPKTTDFPAIQFWELSDVVIDVKDRGGHPIYRRELSVVIEPFIAGSTENASSKELGVLVQEMKKKIYQGGPTLGKRCVISESEASRVHRPPTGENAAGVGIALIITYIEEIAKLF